MNGYNFTERVRNVLAMAREEAMRLRHEYVGTEHILLALLHDDEGVASAVLQNLSIELDEIRDGIEKVVKVGKAPPRYLDLPYTTRAKKVLELSMREARDLNHNYVGTEHLLLGLLREEKGIAAQVLTGAGITTNAARDEVLHLLGKGNDQKNSPPFVTAASLRFPPNLDALTAAPQHHRLLLENEHVRVLETQIQPGETTPIHTHRWPAVYYVISWSQFVRRDPDGAVLLDTRETDVNQNSPQALWGAALPAHTVENAGSAPLHIISVEIKSRS